MCVVKGWTGKIRGTRLLSPALQIATVALISAQILVKTSFKQSDIPTSQFPPPVRLCPHRFVSLTALVFRQRTSSLYSGPRPMITSSGECTASLFGLCIPRAGSQAMSKDRRGKRSYCQNSLPRFFKFSVPGSRFLIGSETSLSLISIPSDEGTNRQRH